MISKRLNKQGASLLRFKKDSRQYASYLLLHYLCVDAKQDNDSLLMRPITSNYIALKKLKTAALGLTALILLSTLFASCAKEKQEYVHQKYDPELLPTIDTDSVTMKISDSGRVKYKVVTKRMQIFDQAKDPHWLFPKGIYLEQYDSAFKVSATIVADTVWNFTRRALWQLRGHVVIKNVKGATFKSEELFWDQRQQKVYTDKFIRITTPDRDLQGYGMDASQDLSQYQIRRASGTMKVAEEVL